MKPLYLKYLSDGRVIVSKKFIVGNISIPTDFSFKSSVNNNKLIPTIVHQYLYSLKGNRKEADQEYLKLLKESGVGFIEAYSVYYAARLFGGLRHARKTGEA